MHACAANTGQVLQGALHRICTGCAVHALHQQNGLGNGLPILFFQLREVPLFERIIEHEKVIRDVQGTTMDTENIWLILNGTSSVGEAL